MAFRCDAPARISLGKKINLRCETLQLTPCGQNLRSPFINLWLSTALFTNILTRTNFSLNHADILAKRRGLTDFYYSETETSTHSSDTTSMSAKPIANT
jgi:hypothetical protein